MSKDFKTFESLNNLLEDKLELLNQIHELTKLQCEKIEEDSIEKLLNLINSKQIRIDKIKNIDIRYLNILNQNAVNKINDLGFDHDLYLKLEDKESRTKEVAAKTYELEQNNQYILTKKFELVKQKLKGFKKGKKVTSSYYKIPTQSSGYFIDKKS